MYNAHHEMPDANMCAAVCMAWSLYGAFPRRLASRLLGAEDHLRGGTLIYCLSVSLYGI